jgi:calcineurin-like phosphoesterase family protein
VVEIFVTGRDDKNRSKIGKVYVDLTQNFKILSIDKEPVFSLGGGI